MGNAAGDGGFSFNGATRVLNCGCAKCVTHIFRSVCERVCVVYSVHNISHTEVFLSRFFGCWFKTQYDVCAAGKWELILTNINHHWTTTSTGFELLSMVQAHVSEQYFHRSLLFCVLAAGVCE